MLGGSSDQNLWPAEEIIDFLCRSDLSLVVCINLGLTTFTSLHPCKLAFAQPRLSLDREVREIENGLRHSRKHFDVKQQWATRPKDLRRALLDHKPEYVHFCGHGAGRDGIVLEGQFIDAEALAELFRLFSASMKCVVLNACYSTVQAQAIAKHRELAFVHGHAQNFPANFRVSCTQNS